MELEQFVKTLAILSQHEDFRIKLEELNSVIEKIWYRTGEREVYELGRKIMFILKEMNRH